MHLTIQILCRGDAVGLEPTLQSIEEAARNCRNRHLDVETEVQLLPWKLRANGLERLTICCAETDCISWLPALPRREAELWEYGVKHSLGSWFWWLETGDTLQAFSIGQWAEYALNRPGIQLIAAEGDHLGANREITRRQGAPSPHHSLANLIQAELYCPGAFAIHRNILRDIPLSNYQHYRTAYREAWLLAVIEQRKNRIDVNPQPWVQTHQLTDWNYPGRCRQRALELAKYAANQWGQAPAGLLDRYGQQLQSGAAWIPSGSTALTELGTALNEAHQALGDDNWQRVRLCWGLEPEVAPWQNKLETALLARGLKHLWCVTLIRNLLHPEFNSIQARGHRGELLELAEQLISPSIWKQYRLLRQDPELLAVLNEPVMGIPLISLLHWQREPELQRQYPLPDSLEQYRNWWAGHASSSLQHIHVDEEGQVVPEPFFEEPLLSREQKPFGVNLIGHAFEVFGIGEDVRMAALALESAEVPFCVVNVPANNGAAASDRSLEAHTLANGQLGPYRFNLVCLAAPSHGAWIAREGLAQQRGRCTIVAWPWETQTWPKAWECMIPLADVLWPSSTFTAKALEPFSDPLRRPQQVMPMAVHIELPEQYREPAFRSSTRERWGLEQDAHLVLIVFDVKSSLARKNPWGAIEAFQQAFPPDSQAKVQLVIKALRPGSPNQRWDRLQQQAEQDPRLKVIEADLKRADLLALMGSCDTFLSLHRSEGFGRGIAEAGILGLQVITSAWGGNLDFCEGESFHLVPCAATSIPPGTYAQGDGHIWGEPNLQVAAEYLRQAVSAATHSAGANSRLHQLSISATGDRYYRALRGLRSAKPTGASGE